jgi:hypothetical protein
MYRGFDRCLRDARAASQRAARAASQRVALPASQGDRDETDASELAVGLAEQDRHCVDANEDAFWILQGPARGVVILDDADEAETHQPTTRRSASISSW